MVSLYVGRSALSLRPGNCSLSSSRGMCRLSSAMMREKLLAGTLQSRKHFHQSRSFLGIRRSRKRIWIASLRNQGLRSTKSRNGWVGNDLPL